MTDRQTFRRSFIVVIVLWGLAMRLLLALDHQHFNPLIDDSFYAFSIARNIAEGEGVTYSGTPTNGFQPLFIYLCVPFYWVFGRNDPVAIHAILVMLALVSSGTGLLVYGWLRSLKCPIGALLGLAVLSLSPHFIANGVNGLETPLTAFFVVLSGWVYTARVRRNPDARWQQSALLGVLLGLGVLARVDLGFWAVALALDYVIFARACSAQRRLAIMSLCAVTAFVVCSPWFIYNQAVFGSVLPTSGSGVRLISLALGYDYWGRRYEYFPLDSVPVEYYQLSLLASLRVILNSLAPPMAIFTLRGFVVVLLAVGVAAWRRLGATLRENTHLALFPLVQVAAYSFWILGQWFYPRYYFATTAVLVIWICIAVEGLVDRLPGMRRGTELAAAVLAGAMALLAWNSLPQAALRGTGSDGTEHQIGVRLLREHVPPGATVGGFQSGALQYYGRDWHVVNLDGVVNRAAHEAMRDSRMAPYLRENGIDWMLDLDWVIDALYSRRAGLAEPMAEWQTTARTGQLFLHRRKHAAAER